MLKNRLRLKPGGEQKEAAGEITERGNAKSNGKGGKVRTDVRSGEVEGPGEFPGSENQTMARHRSSSRPANHKGNG